MTDPKLLSQSEINNLFVKMLEDEDALSNRLYDTWESGDFPSNCDDGDNDTYETSLSKIRETPLEALDNNTQNGTVGIDEVVILYKSLIELIKKERK